MATMIPLAATLFLLAPQDPVEQARRLIEQLRSDSVEERDKAAQKLVELGNAALTELDKACADRDAEVAARAKKLVLVIRMSGRLTSNLKATLPDVVERLALGDAHAWTEVFLEAVAAPEGKRRHPGLKAEDLDALAGPAVRAARTTAETKAAASAIGDFKFRSAARDLVEHLPGVMRKELLEDDNPVFQGEVELLVKTLIKLRPKELVPDLVKMVRNEQDSFGRDPATAVLLGLGNEEAARVFIPLLADEAPMVRAHAAKVLARLGAKEAVSGLTKLLEDKTIVRGEAALALGQLGAKDAVTRIVKLLSDSEREVVKNALRALLHLRAREGSSEAVKLLKHADADIRYHAMDLLAEVEGREAEAEIAKLLSDPEDFNRISAAIRLCHMGSRAAVAAMLKDESHYSRISLNALRKPDLWKKLREKTVPGDYKIVGSEMLKLVAKETGMAYDGPEFHVPVSTAGPAFAWDRTEEPPRIPLTDALGWCAGGERDILLEDDRIRVVSRDEARRFWQAWWDEERKKAK